jgi:DNA-binding LacI/PurR family transcriptional regulator
MDSVSDKPLKRLPKLAAIAEKAGVSTMSVSNVLRGRAVVASEMKLRVHNALKEMGLSASDYQASAGRSVHRRRSRSLLLLERGFLPGALASPIYGMLLRGVRDRCQELGFDLQVRHIAEDKDVVSAAESFTGSGVLLFGDAASAQPFIAKDGGLGVVRLMGTGHNTEPGVDVVGYDDRRVGELAAQALFAEGCRKLVYIGDNPRTRQASFEATARSLGCQVSSVTDEAIYHSLDGQQLIDHTALEVLWDRVTLEEPDGVFVMSDQICSALYGLLYRVGKLPGVNPKIVSCNREQPFLNTMNPAPPSVGLNVAEVGRVAVDQLFWRLDHLADPARRILIAPEL